jgi:hypothetical protein
VLPTVDTPRPVALIMAPVAIKTSIVSQQLGAQPKFIERISFSHQDLCVHPSSIFFFFLGGLQPGWKIVRQHWVLLGAIGCPKASCQSCWVAADHLFVFHWPPQWNANRDRAWDWVKWWNISYIWSTLSGTGTEKYCTRNESNKKEKPYQKVEKSDPK